MSTLEKTRESENVRHKTAYQFWRTHKRSAVATAEEYSRAQATIAKWRDEECWEREADAADAQAAQGMADAEALARSTAADAIQQALANAIAMQRAVRDGLLSGQTDAMDIGAAASHLRAAVAAADTVYGWSKLKVEHSGEVAVTDTAAIQQRLLPRLPELLREQPTASA